MTETEKTNSQNRLGTDRIGPLFFRLALPAVAAQLVNALYNIVDRIYIGRIPITGAAALTGIGICFPVTMLISALSSLIGVGGQACASIAMGEGRNEKAERILGSCTTLLIAVAVVCGALFEWLREPMLRLFGGSDNTVPYASEYLKYYLMGTLPILLTLGLNNFIAAQGFSATSMCTTLIGAMLNIGLDPVFIFALNMGVKGAAVATVLSQMVSCIWVIVFFLGKRTGLHLRLRSMKPDWRLLGPVLAIGVSPFVMIGSESILNIAFNTSLQRYGGDMAVGALTVASSIMTVQSCFFSGLAQGSQAILGFNYGAGQSKRVRKAFYTLFGTCVGFSFLFCLAIELFPGIFVGLFSKDEELYAVAVWALRIYASGMFMLGVQHSCQQSFVALAQAKISLFLAVLRKFILLIPLIYLLPFFFSDRVFAVFLAEPIADICAGMTTGILFFTRLPKILARREKEIAAQS